MSGSSKSKQELEAAFGMPSYHARCKKIAVMMRLEIGASMTDRGFCAKMHNGSLVDIPHEVVVLVERLENELFISKQKETYHGEEASPCGDEV